MSDLHIDDFFRDSAKILISLYAHFPKKTSIYVADISGADTPDEFGLHSPRHQACFDTMLWLTMADYITFEQTAFQEAIEQAVLTHRGFLTLNSVVGAPMATVSDLPHTIAHEESLAIHHLRHELKFGTSFSLAEFMRNLMNRSRTLGEFPKII